jgi:predicted NUDIX family NTP pyrophosphohydrolase
MEITCGIFIINADNKMLLVHPTNSSETVWSIPKGRMDEGETEINTAYREVKEETNIDLLQYGGNLIPLGKAKYRKRSKTLCAFALEYNGYFHEQLKCHTWVNGIFPEVDKYKWVTFREAFSLIHETQQILLQKYLKNRK